MGCFSGLGLLILLTVVRGAYIGQTQSGQCEVGTVLGEMYGSCLGNTTSFKSMIGIVKEFRHEGPGAFTANDAINVLEEFCRDLQEMGTCVLFGIESCEDSVQKLKIVKAFREKSSICEASPWIVKLFQKHGDEVMANPMCLMSYMSMVNSCGEEEMEDVFDGVDSSTSMSKMIDLLNVVRDTAAGCLVIPGLLPQGCDVTSVQTIGAFMAMIMNIIAPPGLSLTSEQLDDIYNMV